MSDVAAAAPVLTDILADDHHGSPTRGSATRVAHSSGVATSAACGTESLLGAAQSSTGGDATPRHVQRRMTPFIMLLTAMSAIGGFLFGYDTGVVSGAVLILKDEFHLSDFEVEVRRRWGEVWRGEAGSSCGALSPWHWALFSRTHTDSIACIVVRQCNSGSCHCWCCGWGPCNQLDWPQDRHLGILRHFPCWCHLHGCCAVAPNPCVWPIHRWNCHWIVEHGGPRVHCRVCTVPFSRCPRNGEWTSIVMLVCVCKWVSSLSWFVMFAHPSPQCRPRLSAVCVSICVHVSGIVPFDRVCRWMDCMHGRAGTGEQLVHHRRPVHRQFGGWWIRRRSVWLEIHVGSFCHPCVYSGG